MTRVVAVINFKGGVGKTTTTAFLLHALADAERRNRVAGADADPHAQLLRWAGLARWTIPVLGLPTATLHRQIWGVIDRDRVDVVCVDTPPLEEKAGIVVSVLRVATDVIVPMAPTMIELDRIGPVFTAIEDAAAHHDTDLRAHVLLCRTVSQASSTETIRELLTEQGRPVLTATVPRLERYAQSFGTAITPTDGPYGAVATELIGGWQ